MPAAFEMSFFGIGPIVASVSGRYIATVAKPRTIIGQKKSSGPVCGAMITRIQNIVPASTIEPPPMSRRASSLPLMRPMFGNMIADASAPGSSKRPVCCAVKWRIDCAKIGTAKVAP